MTATGPTELCWLPEDADVRARLMRLARGQDTAWRSFVDAARVRLDFVTTNHLASSLARTYGATPPTEAVGSMRLAVVASSTVEHLLPAIRVGACRRNLWVDIHVGPYGQTFSELADRTSATGLFAPTAILICLDAHHLFSSPVPGEAAVDEAFERIRRLWSLAKENFGAQVLQQTVLPVFPALMGSNEHRLLASRRRCVDALNERIRIESDRAGVDLVDVADAAHRHGLAAWHDPALWFRAKQEVGPLAAPLFGDLVARVLAARRGRSGKCLVLDLDNTLWGGVIGDDGLGGIAIGQGNAEGEAFLAFQEYALALSKRGVILAVCSKNDEANARLPFERHGDMLLRLDDISCFIANWDDKATNIERIARELNIGVDSIVFCDDNPFERNWVRSKLPDVCVPELPTDPALYVGCVADAGYFESCSITSEDLSRRDAYAANAERAALEARVESLDDYLRELAMTMHWGTITDETIVRATQLINKTNQFNLTTRRYAEEDVRRLAEGPAPALWFRLTDRFGDNGLIAVVLCRANENGEWDIDCWLMSCRVLKRGVERAMLDCLVEEARRCGVRALLGTYRPTEKNAMVADLYRSLGFEAAGEGEYGATHWRLDVATHVPADVPIERKLHRQD